MELKLADQGSRRAVDLLRFPSRTLEANQNHQSNRERIRYRSQPDPQNQGLSEPQNGHVYGLQADDVSQEEMAKAQRHKPTALSHSRG